jgi:hypothetical protein
LDRSEESKRIKAFRTQFPEWVPIPEWILIRRVDSANLPSSLRIEKSEEDFINAKPQKDFLRSDVTMRADARSSGTTGREFK